MCEMCNAISYKENCVGIVLNSENLKFKKKTPVSEFPNICHITCNSYHTHLCYSSSSLVLTQTDEGNNVCIEGTDYDVLRSDCTGWGSGSNGHSCIGLKTISSWS